MRSRTNWGTTSSPSPSGGNARIHIWRAEGGITLGSPAVYGNCQFDYADAFERSVIGWAGEASKCIYRDEDTDLEELSAVMMVPS